MFGEYCQFGECYQVASSVIIIVIMLDGLNSEYDGNSLEVDKT